MRSSSRIASQNEWFNMILSRNEIISSKTINAIKFKFLSNIWTNLIKCTFINISKMLLCCVCSCYNNNTFKWKRWHLIGMQRYDTVVCLVRWWCVRWWVGGIHSKKGRSIIQYLRLGISRFARTARCWLWIKIIYFDKISHISKSHWSVAASFKTRYTQTKI